MLLSPLVLYTTRPIRSGETPGKEYQYVSDEELESLRNQGKIIEERSYHTVYGIWTYATADDGKIDLSQKDYLGIGTLESYVKIQKYYGGESVCAIYIEVEDGIRLERALTFRTMGIYQTVWLRFINLYGYSEKLCNSTEQCAIIQIPRIRQSGVSCLYETLKNQEVIL
jgi:guanylate kinase